MSASSREYLKNIIDSVDSMHIGNPFQLEDELHRRRWSDLQQEYEMGSIERVKDTNGEV